MRLVSYPDTTKSVSLNWHYEENIADMVLVDLVIEQIDQTQQLAASRLGHLMTAQRSKSSMPGSGLTKGTSKPGRAHFVQMNSMPSPAQKDTQQTPSKVR